MEILSLGGSASPFYLKTGPLTQDNASPREASHDPGCAAGKRLAGFPRPSAGATFLENWVSGSFGFSAGGSPCELIGRYTSCISWQLCDRAVKSHLLIRTDFDFGCMAALLGNMNRYRTG